MGRECRTDTFGHLPGRVGIGTLQQGNEFFATNARRVIAGPQGVTQQQPHQPQCRITRRVTEFVVLGLEVIGIENKQAEIPVLGAQAMQAL